MKTVLFLICSNIFMTAAWYGHLKFKETALPLIGVIGICWLIALPEYCCQVPANRIGRFEEGYTAPQLKILQEAISITAFVVFSIFFLGESPKLNDWVGFGLILAAVLVMMVPRWSDPNEKPMANGPPAVEREAAE